MSRTFGGAVWGQAPIAPCRFGTGLERLWFLPKKGRAVARLLNFNNSGH